MTGLHRGARLSANGPFCAPFALSVLTGRPMEEFLPRDRAGRVERRGTFSLETTKHLERLGVSFEVREFPVRRSGRMRVGPRLRDVLRPGERGLVTVTRHMLAFDGLLVMDTHSPRLTWVFDHPSARQRATRAWVLTPVRAAIP